MAKEGIAAGGVMDIYIVLQDLVRISLIHDGLSFGVHKGIKALDKCKAHLCELGSIHEPICLCLVKAFCAER